jgi:hypothetical protein
LIGNAPPLQGLALRVAFGRLGRSLNISHVSLKKAAPTFDGSKAVSGRDTRAGRHPLAGNDDDFAFHP